MALEGELSKPLLWGVTAAEPNWDAVYTGEGFKQNDSGHSH
jgi:hypothetical protein